MRERKTTLARMGIYYLLLAINIIPCANVIPDRFPTRNLSSIWLLALCVCLVLYYAHRVSPVGALSAMMRALSWMALLMILLRAVKYSTFAEVGVLARHTWYLYYVPLLLMPLFLFDIALLISPRRAPRGTAALLAALAVTAAMIALVVTNDLHQLVFRFRPGFEDWDHTYFRGLLFYLVNAWQYALYIAAVVILTVKCRVGSAKRNAWLLLIPFAAGIAMNVLLFTGRMPKLNGVNVIEFPEALICMAAAVLEGCMQLGLIPTNTYYGKLFPLFSISAQITDLAGRPVYASSTAAPLSAEQFALPDGARLDEHTVLHRMPLPGGFGFWQDDMTELDRLNGELAETGEALKRETELIRLRNGLKEKQAKLQQRTLVYDAIARRTRRQSRAILQLAEGARQSDDPAQREIARRRITLLGAYIKRYANLTLLSQEHGEIEAGELGLSIAEVLRYLNACGIPGECISRAEGAAPADAALAAFERFEAMLEADLSHLRGVFIALSGQGDVTLKMTFENLTGPLPDGGTEALSAASVRSETQREDDVTYVCLTLPKGGEGL